MSASSDIACLEVDQQRPASTAPRRPRPDRIRNSLQAGRARAFASTADQTGEPGTGARHHSRQGRTEAGRGRTRVGC